MSHTQNQFKIEERRRQVASLIAQSLTERQIAEQLRVSQTTVHRDVEALREMSQQFVRDLARSDLAHFYKQSLDVLDEVMKESWIVYRSTNADIETRDRLAALKLIKDCDIGKFEMLNSGPSILSMKIMNDRIERVEKASAS